MSKRFGCFALALIPLAIPAHATIVTNTYEVGNLVKPPASVVPGALTNNMFINDQRTQMTTGAQIPAGTIEAANPNRRSRAAVSSRPSFRRVLLFKTVQVVTSNNQRL